MMVTAIGEIATQQASATNLTMCAITQLLNYAASNPDAEIRFHASDMLVYVARVMHRIIPSPKPDPVPLVFAT
jgi:hypothetical protein